MAVDERKIEFANSHQLNVGYLRRFYLEHKSEVLRKVFRVVKFGLVGLSGVGVNIGILWLFTDVVGFFYLLSAVIAHILSVSNNFTWNQLWTFRDRNPKLIPSILFKGWLKFQLSCLGVAITYLSVLTLLTQVVGLHYIISSLCAIVAAFPVNFLLSTLWVWKSSHKSEQTLN